MTGNRVIDKMLIGINIIFILAAAGLYAYSTFFFERPLPNDIKEFSKFQTELKELARQDPHKLKQLTLNLHSSKTRLRFLDAVPHILTFRAAHVEIIKKYEHVLIDIIIEIVGNLTVDEVNSVSGRIILENRIKNNFNNYMGKKIIKKVFFSTLVIS